MPENLTDMKRTKAEKKEGSETACCPGDQEDYPYGLRIHLNTEEIEKLGISLPEVGSTMVLIANAKVVSVRESADENGNDRNIEFQITEMELAPYKNDNTDHVKKLYSE
ncbi:hypothetical protein KAR91_23420 [Candidatus Pacearchaeota archaeon]|nr:hypothetical protein [Candidatus Pacearchaeota archaeon]